MEQINLDFLRIIAPVSATLMGFAFLTPIIQAFSSGVFTRANACIEGLVLWRRIFSLISLPVFVFFWPFLNSSLLLTSGGSTQIVIIVVSIILAVTDGYWFVRIKLYSGYAYLAIIVGCFEVLPLLVFGGYLVYLVILIRYPWNFANFIYATNLVFISAGLLLLLQSLMASLEKGMEFKASEMKLREGDEKGFREQVEGDFKRIEKALETRKSQVRQLQGLPLSELSHTEVVERRRCIAKHCSEIRFLREQYKGSPKKGFKGLRKQWKRLNEEKFPLIELFDFDDERSKIIRDYLPEFERVTNELKILLKEIKRKDC